MQQRFDPETERSLYRRFGPSLTQYTLTEAGVAGGFLTAVHGVHAKSPAEMAIGLGVSALFLGYAMHQVRQNLQRMMDLNGYLDNGFDRAVAFVMRVK